MVAKAHCICAPQSPQFVSPKHLPSSQDSSSQVRPNNEHNHARDFLVQDLKEENMPQTDEAAQWYGAVYSAVQQVPYGHVTTYGHIALLVGYPKRARQVGICLKHLPAFLPNEPDLHYFHAENVPWQRIINSKGEISVREGGGKERQAESLRAEGVEVLEGRTGELHVDLSHWGWFPDDLDDEIDDASDGSQLDGHR